MAEITTEGAVRLAAEIIGQAVSDYKDLCNGFLPYEWQPNSKLKQEPLYMEALRSRHMKELERFFASQWFDTLLGESGVTPERVIKYLEKYKKKHWRPMQINDKKPLGAKRKIICCKETGEVFKDKETLSKHLGVSMYAIYRAIKAKRAIKGYHYEEVTHDKR